MNSEVKSLISYYVSKRYSDYYQLPAKYKCELVAAMLRSLPKYDRDGILADADRESVLPAILINLIESQFSSESVNKLTNELLKIFVTGSANSHTCFYNDISEYFDDALSDRYPVNNEHFIHDAKQRALEAKWGQSL